MLLELFRSIGSDGFGLLLLDVLISIPIILFSLTIHECSHAFAAYKLGDPTARNLGRLTLNPLKHLDPIGTVMMLVFGFGWAKPVPIVSRNFKNPKWGMCLSALAGPLSNLVFSFVSFFIYYALNSRLKVFTYQFGTSYYDPSSTFAYLAVNLFYIAAYMNIFLFVFNLLPVPPLDGSRIMYVVLPTKIYFNVMKYERIIYIILIMVIASGASSGFLTKIAELFVGPCGSSKGLFGSFASLIFG